MQEVYANGTCHTGQMVPFTMLIGEERLQSQLQMDRAATQQHLSSISGRQCSQRHRMHPLHHTPWQVVSCSPSLLPEHCACVSCHPLVVLMLICLHACPLGGCQVFKGKGPDFYSRDSEPLHCAQGHHTAEWCWCQVPSLFHQPPKPRLFIRRPGMP